MQTKEAGLFWERYQSFVNKDLPVILKTGIKQSTISTWRTLKKFPRADEAFKIADAINTTVEYLVTGKDKKMAFIHPKLLKLPLLRIV